MVKIDLDELILKIKNYSDEELSSAYIKINDYIPEIQEEIKSELQQRKLDPDLISNNNQMVDNKKNKSKLIGIKGLLIIYLIQLLLSPLIVFLQAPANIPKIGLVPLIISALFPIVIFVMVILKKRKAILYSEIYLITLAILNIINIITQFVMGKDISEILFLFTSFIGIFLWLGYIRTSKRVIKVASI